MHGPDRVGCGRAAKGLRGGRARWALLALGLTAALSGCSDPGVVGVQAKLQEAPSLDSAVLAVIPKGSAIKVGDCNNGWCRVSWNGRDGYVLTKSVHLGAGSRRASDTDDSDDDVGAAPDIGSVPSSR